MLTKLLKIAEKSSQVGRSYTQGVLFEQLGMGCRQVFTFTNGFYVIVYSRRTNETAEFKTMLHTGDSPCCDAKDYPDVNSVVGGDKLATNGKDMDIEKAISQGSKIANVMATMKPKAGKTHINPETLEVTHDGPKPGTINAKWLSDFIGMGGDYLQYHGHKDDLHHFTLAGKAGSYANFFCLAVVNQ